MSSVVPVQHADISALGLIAWRDRLFRSIDAPVQDGRVYPGFPSKDVQRSFVGSSDRHALKEAYRFYRRVQPYLKRGTWRNQAGGYLDFGSGWGRIGRFFLREFERDRMFGVDVDPEMMAFCREALVPGEHWTIEHHPPLPFDDRAFKLVTAYSVFTHLPPSMFQAWIAELLRVTAAGGFIVITTEPPRFLDFVAAIDREAPASGWHAGLVAALGDLEARRQTLRRRGIAYLPTGGGAFRGPDVYGDTVVTRDYVLRSLGDRGRLIHYLDDHRRSWQAVSIIRRAD